MITRSSEQFSGRRVPAASTRFVLTSLLAASTSVAFAGIAPPGGINNPVSQFFHTVDGLFTDGVGTGEWSDVTPAAFISTPGATAVPTVLGDPLANSLLFAGLGRTSAASDLALYLLYDFLPRTPGTPISPGEVFASITFPITLDGLERNISVLFEGITPASPSGGGGSIGSFFDVFVDLDLNGTGDFRAANIGIIGDADFGPSPLSTDPHLLVELEVPLRIESGFGTPGGPIPGNGINPATGLYDPDPAFWGAAASGDERGIGDVAQDGAGLQPASAANFTINPDGSTSVVPVPEPSSTALALAGLALLGVRRRKS